MSASQPHRLVQFWDRYARQISIVTLVSGFCFDLILAKRPDSLYDNALLVTYLVVTATAIVLLNLRAHSVREVSGERPLALLLILQFCFGGLAGNLLILYGKSGTLGGSLLFILMLFGMIIGNEILKDRYAQASFNIAVYYLLLLTYCIIAVPTFILHTIGVQVFLISGGISLAVMTFFFLILRTTTGIFVGDAGLRRRRQMRAIVIGIFAFFTALYFLNIIPPVPLALKDIGIYHLVVRDSSDNYVGTYEAAPWWEFWRGSSGTYTMTASSGTTAYCFSSVFAPTNLSTPIRHRWEYYNPATGAWETTAIVSFPITGGLATGYHGYSQKALFAPGEWRCDVETGGGQLIGRVSFTAAESSVPPVLVSKKL